MSCARLMRISFCVISLTSHTILALLVTVVTHAMFNLWIIIRICVYLNLCVVSNICFLLPFTQYVMFHILFLIHYELVCFERTNILILNICTHVTCDSAITTQSYVFASKQQDLFTFQPALTSKTSLLKTSFQNHFFSIGHRIEYPVKSSYFY